MTAPDSNCDLEKIWNNPERLEEFTNRELDRRSVQDDDFPFENLPRVVPPPMTASKRHQILVLFAMSEAREGNPERLRQLYPELAEFIHSPPPHKRGRRPYAESGQIREMALSEVPAIHQIWRQHFGKSYAPHHGPTALEIAARRYGLTEAELDNYCKNRHRRR
jgi:hypothetical protein